MPKLSIITINYNNLEGLKRTVENVVSQTWKEFEYIIIDGGSTDGSAEYLIENKEAFTYCVSEPDNGIYHAMNKGIKEAKGEYLLFLNSGDHFFNLDSLKENHNFLKQNDLVCFDLKIISDDSNDVVRFPQEIKFSDLYVSSYYSLLHPSTFIKNDLFKTVGLYDEEFKIVSDWKFFMLALFKFNCSYFKVDTTLTCFYLGGISSGNDNYIEREAVLQADFKALLSDYDELIFQRNLLNTNRYRMLQEIENTFWGRKIISLFLRSYIVLFLKKRLRDIIR